MATIQQQLPADFHPQSRVWIYQSNRPFSEQESKEINEQLHQFTSQWLSHGDQVKGWGTLFFNQVIVILADESQAGVSGCSTDSSVRIIKSIERQYDVNLFDRLLLGFLVEGKVQLLPMVQLLYALEKGKITPETVYLNNTVQTKAELENNWLIPLGESWLKTRLQQAL
ncbi:hypothetical protein GA0116948_109118 [Chitinophaga costaii]|uniref:ABC transporter ATPase n=1 Tax=Chitinophaga costaii TaxID=1335309 RepID=A0A1C4EQJ7_9BACT|nr:hypothetical protein [Chitinophaga costaii]PUZ22521.1 hypothetical protein DCM91_14735 [Chitinophaga costaii]SCC45856.1 hypothetical protein GA0116948_109118 [Chitinophaga costaii]